MRVDPVSQVCPLKCRLSEGESDHVVCGERFYFDIILDMKL